jgi:predicted transcriptional regulator
VNKTLLGVNNNHYNNTKEARSDLQRRRSEAYQLRLEGLTEEDIAQRLGCDQVTVSRYLKACREDNQRFVYEVAKDVGAFYKECLDSIDLIKRRAWEMYHKYEKEYSPKCASVCLKAQDLALRTEVERFKLFVEGPNIVAINAMSEKLDQIEQAYQNANR